MCEPTESESKEELDRFCDALLAIREEIREIETGKLDKTDNMLKNAPHTMAEVSGAEWTHPYSRHRVNPKPQPLGPQSATTTPQPPTFNPQPSTLNKAAYPIEPLRANKFWPTIKRIDDGTP